jgi:hypothetical protein
MSYPQSDQPNSITVEHGKSVLPGFLNVLTILTLIGSVIGIITAIFGYRSACQSAALIADKDIPDKKGFLGKFLGDVAELAVVQCENRFLILVTTLVTTAFCIMGALLMRNLKKQGFVVYVLGELLAPLAMVIILGSTSFMTLAGFFFPVLFVILYATQLKHLTNQ